MSNQTKNALIIMAVLVIISLMFSCSAFRKSRQSSEDCHVQGTGYKNELGDEQFRVICPGKKPIYIPTIPGPKGDKGETGAKGNTGSKGDTGSAGVNGSSCSVIQEPLGATVSCTDGTTAFIPNGVNGQNGQDGQDGEDGQDGQDGTSCSVLQVSNGAIISCTDGTQGFIANGQDGTDGEDGQDGQDGVDGQDGQDGADAVVEVINPCGSQGQFDEVLFRMSDGFIYALYFGSGNAFLTDLPPGNYQTTDSTRCRFSINSSNQIYNEYNY